MTFLGLPEWIFYPWLFLFGASIGSFLNVCIYRLPRHENLIDQLRGLSNPPSSCPRCGHRIRLRDNLPVIGWLKLHGRCFNCRGRISARYPLIELFNGLLWVFVYWMEVPSRFGATMAESCLWADGGPTGIPGSTLLSPMMVANWRYLYHMVLIEGLVVASFIDFDLKIIPDGSTVPAMIIGLVGGAVIGHVFLVPVWHQDPTALKQFWPQMSHLPADPAWIRLHPNLHGLAVSLAGLVVGGGIVWVVRLLGQWVLRQEAMGFGDVVLMAMIGSFLGWQPTLIVFFLGPVCALAVISISFLFRRHREIPFGPYLSLAALIVILGFRHIWPRIEQLFALGILLPFIGVLLAAGFALSLMIMQFIKRMLGIPLYYDEWIEEWTSADQLTYQSGERVDPNQGTWPREEWPGTQSGRGSVHETRWRNGR